MATHHKKEIPPRIRKKKRQEFFGWLITVLILCITVGALIYLNLTPRLVLTGKNTFQVGDVVHLSDVVKDVKNGTLVTEDIQLNSNKAGAQKYSVPVKNRLGREMELTVQITFTEAPFSAVITAPETLSVFAVEGEDTSVDLLEGVSAADENGVSYPVTVEGDYDLTREGQYVITYVAQTGDGRRVTKDAILTVTVTRSPFDKDGNLVDGTYKTSKGFELVVEKGIAYVDGYMIVNKSYSVPEGFSSTGDGTRSLRPETEQAWNELKAAAPADIRAKLKIKSAVRNIADQTTIFNNYVKNDGLENALTYSAKPRHSEHHTGLAMDVITSSTEESQKPEVATALDWLDQNAWKYGFIKRYPEGKTNETGYIFEPWHYRYVGVELAEKLYNNGDWITMEAYFGIDSEYKN